MVESSVFREMRRTTGLISRRLCERSLGEASGSPLSVGTPGGTLFEDDWLVGVPARMGGELPRIW